MKMIDGLQEFTAIKIGDNFIVQLQTGYNRKDFIVNGVSTKAEQMVVNSLDSIYYQKPSTRVIIHYSDGNTDRSKEDIETIRRELHKCQDEDGEVCFPDLETEFEVRKRVLEVKDFHPVYEEITYPPEKVEIEVVGEMCDTGSEFIHTSYTLGLANFKHSTGAFKVMGETSIAADEFKKICIAKELKYEIPTHSGLKYAKINGEYVFTNTNSSFVDSSNNRVFATLEEAQAHEKLIRDNVKSVILTVTTKDTLDNLSVARVYKELKSIERRVRELDLKQKSRTSKSGLLKALGDLASSLEVK